MLLDRYRQLLTAYVDGEITNRQRRHVARLLHRSPEARQLLQQLQQDARSLRQLPYPQLPVDLTGSVLHTIAERRLTPGRRRVARVSPAASWAGPLAAWAAAAAILLILGVASYLYFAASLLHSGNADFTEKPKEPSATVAESPDSAPTPIARHEKPTPDARDDKPSNPPHRPPVVESPEVVQRPPEGPKKPTPEPRPAPPKEEPVLTDRLEMFQFSKVSDVLPEVFKVSEFDRDAIRKNLIAELRKDANFRLELPCQNGTRAFQCVQSAAQALNIGLVIEKGARERLKLQARTNYVVYLENLTPDEVAHFLRQIGAEDAKNAARKPAEAQFDRLVLTRMTPQNHKELSTLLGIDPTESEPATKGPLGVDPRKPLTDVTAQQVGQALAGQGATPRPQPGKPAAKPPERNALVLAYNPVRPSPGSDEIKRFLDSRKPVKAGTIRVLLVLRS
jgi:hypothetical protein